MDAHARAQDELNRPTSMREVLSLTQQQLFERAIARSQHNGSLYAGHLYPPEAWLLAEEGVLLLVDVRTQDELFSVGRVPGAMHIAWQIGADLVHNPNFIEELDILAGRENAIALLCRSGKRSAAAATAAAQAGFTRVFNVLEGCEGGAAAQCQQGAGWLNWRLPWLQD